MNESVGGLPVYESTRKKRLPNAIQPSQCSMFFSRTVLDNSEMVEYAATKKPITNVNLSAVSSEE
jgi:hypothetical protein